MKIVALVCLMISFFMHTTSLSAQNSQKYKPYQHIFNHRTHIDGEPLLADGKVEFYLFPGAKRERMPDRISTCGERFAVGVAKLAVDLIRTAASSRSRWP